MEYVWTDGKGTDFGSHVWVIVAEGKLTNPQLWTKLNSEFLSLFLK
jgi:hypothetical protein